MGICVMFVCIFASQIMDIGKVVLIGFTHVCLSVCLFSHLSVLFGSAICFVFSFLRMFFVLTSRLGHIAMRRHSEMLPSLGAPHANLHISNLHII